jgi:exonuclease III
MKILTYNVRGLGGGEKKAEVRRLVYEKKPLVLCIQETKLESMNEHLVKSLWGEGVHNYSYQPSIGASGGLVTVWDASRIDVTSSVSFSHVLVIKGKVLLTGEDFVIFNVYAPCNLEAKKTLWGNLLLHVQNNNDVGVCVCGDFNSVRSVDERKGRAIAFRLICLFVEDCLLGTEEMEFQ